MTRKQFRSLAKELGFTEDADNIFIKANRHTNLGALHMGANRSKAKAEVISEHRAKLWQVMMTAMSSGSSIEERWNRYNPGQEDLGKSCQGPQKRSSIEELFETDDVFT